MISNRQNRLIQATYCVVFSVTLQFVSSEAIAQPLSAPFPVDTYIGSTFGDPYDSVKLSPAPSSGSCIEIESHDYLQDASNLVQGNTEALDIESYSDLIKEMRFTARAAFNAMSLGGRVSADSAYDLLEKTKISRYSKTKLRSDFKTKPIQVLNLEHVQLKSNWTELLSNENEGERVRSMDRFRAECGDTFIVGKEHGELFFGTSWESENSIERSKKRSVRVKANYASATVKVSGSADYKNLDSSSELFRKTHVKVFTTAPMQSKPQTPKELEKAWREFDSSASESGRLIRLYAMSYDRVKGFPKKGVLETTSSEDSLLVLVGTLWDLRSMREEAQEMLKNQAPYAWGTQTKQRRIKSVRSLLNRWESEYSWLRKKALRCLEQFTKNCEEIATRYSTHPMLAERKYLPLRKESNCDAINFEVRFDNNTEYAYPTDQQTGWEREGYGNHPNDMDGCPVLLIAALDIEPQGSLLKARLVTRKTQKHDKCSRSRGHTQFKHIKSWELFSISDHYNDHGENPVAECAYAGKGVVLPEEDFCVDGSGGTHHGLVSKMENRPGHKVYYQAFSKERCGLLESVNCQLDKKGDDHQLQCKSPSIKPLALDLVNRKDLAANSWTEPNLMRTLSAGNNFGSTTIKQDAIIEKPRVLQIVR